MAINFLAIIALAFFVGQDRSYKNFLISLVMAMFIVLETLSYMYLGRKIDDEFIFFICNINIFHMASSTKLLLLYFAIAFSIILVSVLYFILQKLQVKKFRKSAIAFCALVLLLPFGFVYKILNVFVVDYGLDYVSQAKYSYADIFRDVRGEEYTTNDNIEIYNRGEKHKNLVLIYLESYDQSYLTSEVAKPYTSDILRLAGGGEFYGDIEQLNGTMGTQAGIVSSQCGVKYLSYFIFSNPYDKINRRQKLTCLSDVLNAAGYEQVFLGGANKKLFNKGNFLLSHRYDLVEDRDSLLKKNPDLKSHLNGWGVADYDLFPIASEEFTRLSKSGRPFNLTILTTATHNPGGLRDDRCRNSGENGLLNAAECTNDLVRDFVDFIGNRSDTIVVILPDHRQYETNSLRGKIDTDERKLFVIILNSNSKPESDINYMDLPPMILDRLNVRSSANFLGNQSDRTSKNFVYKVHR